MAEAELHADVLVIGGGMGGMTAAARAAQRGASVAVVEIGEEVGGSAAMSEGYIWTAPDDEVFLQEDPEGDIEQFRLMRAEMDRALEWVGELGVEVGAPLEGVLGFGVGRQIDIGRYLRRARSIVEGSGGWVLLESTATELLADGGAVTGARIANLATGEEAQVLAGATVLATGGFQADPGLRDRYLFRGARELVLRTNLRSDGGGLRLGTEVGAARSERMDGFYGHLVPAPIADFSPAEYASLAQYHSDHGLLIDHGGRRFCDESLGDHVNTEMVARHGTALLVIDERIRRDRVLQAFIPGMDAIDKMAEGGRRGGLYATGNTLEDVAVAAAAWGYDAQGILRTVEEFNRHVSGELDTLDPPRRRNRSPILEPPFAALQVQAAITFTYGGLATDAEGRVQGGDGTAIPGLYAAGVDAGGLNVWGYTGGLVRGLALGRRLAEKLTADLTTRREEEALDHTRPLR